MLSKIIRQSLIPNNQFRFKVTHLTERRINKLNDMDLFNKKYVRKVVKSKHNGTTYKAQRGLYHNQTISTKIQKCFSDKKTVKRVDVNVFKKKYYSDVLGKEVKLNVSSKVFRTIDKYGGFDNYILLAKTEDMNSMFGQYLRKVMMLKINNPELNLEDTEIFGTTPDVFKSRRPGRYYSMPYYSPEYRHKDKTLDQMRLLDDFSKRELNLVN